MITVQVLLLFLLVMPNAFYKLPPLQQARLNSVQFIGYFVMIFYETQSWSKFSLQLCQIQVNNSFLNPVLLNLLFEIAMNVTKPLDFICTSYLVFFVVLGVSNMLQKIKANFSFLRHVKWWVPMPFSRVKQCAFSIIKKRNSAHSQNLSYYSLDLFRFGNEFSREWLFAVNLIKVEEKKRTMSLLREMPLKLLNQSKIRDKRVVLIDI